MLTIDIHSRFLYAEVVTRKKMENKSILTCVWLAELNISVHIRLEQGSHVL